MHTPETLTTTPATPMRPSAGDRGSRKSRTFPGWGCRTGVENLFLWADLDGEFLGPEGFSVQWCGECGKQAVVKAESRYLCAGCLPSGVELPWWVGSGRG
jgi:hypothetical protein